MRWFPPEAYDLTICVDNTQARKAFSPPYTVVCLDHDLGGRQMVDSEEEDTGYQFTVWLPEAHYNNAWVIVHSYNPTGAQRMFDALHTKGYAAVLQPFGPQVRNIVKVLCEN